MCDILGMMLLEIMFEIIEEYDVVVFDGLVIIDVIKGFDVV